MAILKHRRGRPMKVMPPQRPMKYVRVDEKTLIEVPTDVPDEDAVERFNLRRRVAPLAKGMALIALKEAKEEEEVVVPPIDLEVVVDEDEEE